MTNIHALFNRQCAKLLAGFFGNKQLLRYKQPLIYRHIALQLMAMIAEVMASSRT